MGAGREGIERPSESRLPRRWELRRRPWWARVSRGTFPSVAAARACACRRGAEPWTHGLRGALLRSCRRVARQTPTRRPATLMSSPDAVSTGGCLHGTNGSARGMDQSRVPWTLRAPLSDHVRSAGIPRRPRRSDGRPPRVELEQRERAGVPASPRPGLPRRGKALLALSRAVIGVRARPYLSARQDGVLPESPKARDVLGPTRMGPRGLFGS